MNTLMLYLLKSLLISAMLLWFYWVALRNKGFHLFNRYFLIAIPLISIALPLLRVSLPLHIGQSSQPGIKLLRVIAASGWEDAVTITNQAAGPRTLHPAETLVLSAYVTGILVFFLPLYRSLVYLSGISRKYTADRIDNIRLFQTCEPGTPFSFLNSIFWNKDIDLCSIQGRQIFRHERYHVRHFHSADILYAEFLSILFWVNPCFHVIKKELRVIHEFLADRDAVSGNSPYDYAELLIRNSAGPSHLGIMQPFFHNHIKRRITMLTKNGNVRCDLLSRLMVLPFLLFLFCAFSLKPATRHGQWSGHPGDPITIVIDPGHGGTDRGCRAEDGTLEKNLSLQIARKISSLSGEYNVSVIMTRKEDELPGQAATIREGLQQRVNMVNRSGASLFISIHLNAESGQPTERRTGAEIMIPGWNHAIAARSALLGSALVAELNRSFPTSEDLKTYRVPVSVLEKSEIPSVLIECGYMTNKADLAFFKQEANQEKVAMNILEGVVKYHAWLKNQPPTSTTGAMGVPDVKPGPGAPANDPPFTGDTIPAGKETYTKAQLEPEFPGGQQGWTNYLAEHLKYPSEAAKKEIQGTVLMQFIVMEDGTIRDIRVLNSPDTILSKACLAVVQQSGHWLPATRDGKKVIGYKRQPIIFRL